MSVFVKRKFLASAAAGLLILTTPAVADAAEQTGIPFNDQEWKSPVDFAPSFKPGEDFQACQPFAPTQDGNLFAIDLWVFGIGADGTPDDPVLDSAAVYDITDLEYANFDLTEPITGGQAEVGDSVADPDAPGKFRVRLTFPDLPELSEDARYLLVLDHAMADGDSKASYVLGLEQPPPVPHPVLTTDPGIKGPQCETEWCGFFTGRIWHEIFLVDALVPEKPELVESTTCDVPSTIEIPEVDGVEYVVVEDGYTQTVTATVDEGLLVSENADLGPWVFDVTPEPCDDEAEVEDPTGGSSDDPSEE